MASQKDNKNKESSIGMSFARSAVSSIPFVAGVAFAGLRGVSTTRSGISSQASTVPTSTRPLRNLKSRSPTSLSPDTVTNYFSRLGETTEKGASILRESYVRALRATDPLAEEKLALLGDLTTLSGEDLKLLIRDQLANSDSIFRGRTFARFKTNTAILTAHPGASLPVMKVASTLKPKAASVAVAEAPEEVAGLYRKVVSSFGLSGKGIGFFEQAPDSAGMYQLRFGRGKGTVKVSIPMVSSSGVLLEGGMGTTRRIAPSVGIWNRSTGTLTEISRSSYYISQVQEALENTEGLSASQIQRRVNQLYKTHIQGLEATPALSAAVRGKAQTSFENIRGQAIQIMIDEGEGTLRAPTQRELADVQRAHGGLYPSTSPKNIAKGILSKYDPAGWYAASDLVDRSRRQVQANRTWRLTDDAIRAAKVSGNSRWSIFETQQWRHDFGENALPHFRTLYIDPKLRPDLAEALSLKDGEGIILENMHRHLKTYSPASPINLKQVADGVSERIAGGSKFTEGELLGWSLEGNPITYATDMKLRAITETFEDKTGAFSRLELERVNESATLKVFGDAKAVLRRGSRSRVKGALRSKMSDIAIANGFQAIVLTDNLRKDPAKAVKAMYTELWEQTRNIKNPALEAFQAAPSEWVSNISGRTTAFLGGVGSTETVVENLVHLALKGNVSPIGFAAVFGAAPGILGQEKWGAIAANVPATHLAAMGKYEGLSMGIAQFAPTGDLFRDTGAGSMGSIEPRFLEILSGQQWGAAGGSIQDELTRRLIGTNPDKIQTFSALGKTLQSLHGRAAMPSNAAVLNLADGYSREAVQGLIEKGGGWVNLGKGLGNMYLPGSAEALGMMPFLTADEKVVRGEISGAYHSFLEDISGLTGAAARERTQEFTQYLAKEVAPLGKGAGSLTRGKISGSRYLTFVSESQSGVRAANIDELVIGKGYFEDMLSELAQSEGLSDLEIQQMRNLAAQGRLPSMGLRHPGTGPFSMQGNFIRTNESITEPVVVAHTREMPLNYLTGGAAQQARINISPMVGFSGDFDADIGAMFLMSPHSQKQIEGLLAPGSAYRTAWAEHTIRSQLIKAKAAAADTGMTTLDKLIADTMKLGTAQEWTPKLSYTLSKAKTSIYSNLTNLGESGAEALSLLESLEQLPISGKHASRGDVLSGRLGGTLQALTSALEDRSHVRLRDAVSSLLDQSPEARAMISGGDIQLTGDLSELEGAFKTRFKDGRIRSIDTNRAINTIISSMGTGEESGLARTANLLAGRGNIKAGEVPTFLDNIGMGVGGNFADASAEAIAQKNTMSKFGASILKNKKYVGYGFLGSLALGGLLSTVDNTIGPGSALVPEGGIPKRDTAPPMEEPQTDSLIQRAQSAIGMPRDFFSNTARVAPPAYSSRISSKVRVNSRRDLDRALAYGSSSQSESTIRIRDQSSSVLAQDLASRIF